MQMLVMAMPGMGSLSAGLSMVLKLQRMNGPGLAGL